MVLYADELQPLAHYKELEEKFTSFSSQLGEGSEGEGKALWKKTAGSLFKDESDYSSSNQDLVEQLIAGFGWKVRYWYDGPETRAYVVTSPDPNGAKYMIQAKQKASNKNKKQKTDTFDHFRSANLDTFFDSHVGRQGVSVLAFQLPEGGLNAVYDSYQERHPKLIKNKFSYKYPDSDATCLVLEACAYYLPPKEGEELQADGGTILRYVEIQNSGDKKAPPLPGFSECEVGEYTRLVGKSVAYSDHWVSNVVDREGFMQCMSEVLGFTSKVDFNAGVVAAGEAVIESTVIGNDPNLVIATKEEMLPNQGQIYLPTNNPVSEVGHVHLFIKEMGQGIQHLASRVEDLIAFIGTSNKYRRMTGRGFTFLDIPMSYYGRLNAADLTKTGIDASTAETVFAGLVEAKHVTTGGIVTLGLSKSEVETIVKAKAASLSQSDVSKVVECVSQGRYNNLLRLLGDHFKEETYLEIVRNKILVDIQGEDILFQIFTSCVLQRKKGEEAPFLEFIQRVCSEKIDPVTKKPMAIRPGCGGFGIRNFLTLFLSIEVSKAMQEYDTAVAENDANTRAFAQKKVDVFTEQLEESNPILTAISDAMTAEGDALAIVSDPSRSEAERSAARIEADKYAAKKVECNGELMTCSTKYKNMMRELRSSRA